MHVYMSFLHADNHKLEVQIIFIILIISAHLDVSMQLLTITDFFLNYFFYTNFRNIEPKLLVNVLKIY